MTHFPRLLGHDRGARTIHSPQQQAIPRPVAQGWPDLRDYRRSMPLDDQLLAELKRTKAEIDLLQAQLKDLVARLQEGGATTQEITQALRG